MKSLWSISIIALLVLFPISIFLHEAGHWIIYEILGVDSWISLQKANLINPDQLTEDIFLKSLFGGPLITLFLALIALIALRKNRNSIWIMVFGLINSSFRILPCIIGSLTAFNTDLRGISDEGNIALRVTESIVIRELIMILVISYCVFIIIELYKTFRFPDNFSRKKLFVFSLCFLTVLISLTYPLLDRVIFGI